MDRSQPGTYSTGQRVSRSSGLLLGQVKQGEVMRLVYRGARLESLQVHWEDGEITLQNPRKLDSRPVEAMRSAGWLRKMAWRLDAWRNDYVPGPHAHAAWTLAWATLSVLRMFGLLLAMCFGLGHLAAMTPWLSIADSPFAWVIELLVGSLLLGPVALCVVLVMAAHKHHGRGDH